MPSANTSAAADHTDGHKKNGIGHQVGPGVDPHKWPDIFNKGENGHKGEGHQQLSSQHQEHLEGESGLSDDASHDISAMILFYVPSYVPLLFVRQQEMGGKKFSFLSNVAKCQQGPQGQKKTGTIKQV